MKCCVKYIVATVVGVALIGAPNYFPKEILFSLAEAWFIVILATFVIYAVCGFLLFVNYLTLRKKL